MWNPFQKKEQEIITESQYQQALHTLDHIKEEKINIQNIPWLTDEKYLKDPTSDPLDIARLIMEESIRDGENKIKQMKTRIEINNTPELNKQLQELQSQDRANNELLITLLNLKKDEQKALDIVNAYEHQQHIKR